MAFVARLLAGFRSSRALTDGEGGRGGGGSLGQTTCAQACSQRGLVAKISVMGSVGGRREGGQGQGGV